MRITGAGGCFESRKYPLSVLALEDSWSFLKDIATRLEPMKVVSIDENEHIIKGSDGKKNLYTLFTRVRENDEIEVCMDVAPSTIRVYGFSNNAKPVNKFFEELEVFLDFCRNGKYCSSCGRKIPKDSRFCPECGGQQP